MSIYGTFNCLLRQALPERNTFFQGGRSCAGARVAPAEKFGLERKF